MHSLNLTYFQGFGKHTENCFRSWFEDNHFPFPFCKKNFDRKDVDLERKAKSWRRRVDVNMGYYIGLLLTGTILHILYKYPLKNEEGIFATLMRDQVLSGAFQASAVFTQMMIIVGLCLDGGRSLTNRDKTKSWESHFMKQKYHLIFCQLF